MLPARVETIMNQLSGSLSARTSTIQSIYLYGSVALHDYIEGSSDIDFIAIVRNPLTASDVEAIRAAHEEAAEKHPDADMMGAYIQKEELGKPPAAGSSVLTYYNNQLHTDGHGADLNPITWRILQQHGIKVYGEDVSFEYHLDEATLLAYVRNNMNDYWVKWIHRLEQQLAPESLTKSNIHAVQLDEAVEWCTLGMLRQLYTLREKEIASKVAAGQYGLTRMPEKWHALIYEAIAIKQRKPERYYRSQLDRLTDLAAMLRFIWVEANKRKR